MWVNLESHLHYKLTPSKSTSIASGKALYKGFFFFIVSDNHHEPRNLQGERSELNIIVYGVISLNSAVYKAPLGSTLYFILLTC